MSRHSCHEGCWNIYCLEGLERQWRPANIHHHIARRSGFMLNCTVYITQVLWAQSSNTKRCAWEHSYSGPVSFHGMLIKFPEKKQLNGKGLFGPQFKGGVHQGTMTGPGHMGPQLASKAQWVIMLILHSPLYPVWTSPHETVPPIFFHLNYRSLDTLTGKCWHLFLRWFSCQIDIQIFTFTPWPLNSLRFCRC